MNKKNDKHPQAMTLGSDVWKAMVVKGLERLGVSASPAMVDQLTAHARDMLFWNKKTNLTSITDPLDVAVKHVIDSGAAAVLFSEHEKVLDIGTGGGFPGIPLKILKPFLSLTLVDSSRKKVNFVKQVIRSLGLEDINAMESRGEELSLLPEHRGCYDTVISRAFSGLDVFVPMALPFLKPCGRIIAMKGRETEQETHLLEKISVKMNDGQTLTADDFDLDIRSYELPHSDFQRSFMVIRLKK